MLLVRQFRPALYAAALRKAGLTSTTADGKHPSVTWAFACELCAGLVDKRLSLAEIAKEEVLEECGYDVPLEQIRKVTTLASCVGVQGSTQTLFFAEVDESMSAQEAGGVLSDGERIELLGLPLENIDAFLIDDSIPKTAGAMFGLLWAKSHILSVLRG
jgi:UDP-sugar diphosphatase